MLLKAKSKSRRSIGEWFQDFWSNIDTCIHSLGNLIYNRKHREILGRDGKRWSMIKYFLLLFIINFSYRQNSGFLFFLLYYSWWLLLFIFICIYVTFTIKSTEIYRQR